MNYEQAHDRLVDLQKKYDVAFELSKRLLTAIRRAVERTPTMAGLEMIDHADDRIVFVFAGCVVCFHFANTHPNGYWIAIGTLRMNFDGLYFTRRTHWWLRNNQIVDSRGNSFTEDDAHQQFHIALAEAVPPDVVPKAELVAISNHLNSGMFLGGV
jgi:hypothetical protein